MAHVQKKSAHRFLLAVVFLLLALGGGEFLFKKTPLARRIAHSGDFRAKRARYAIDGGDIVVVGSSRIREGLRPELVSARLTELTGTPLTVFNFGTPSGLPAVYAMAAAAVRAMPAARKPRLFVIGLAPIELVDRSWATQERFVANLRARDLPFLVRAVGTNLDEGARELAYGLFTSMAYRDNVLDYMKTKALPAEETAREFGAPGDNGTVSPAEQDRRAWGRTESYRKAIVDSGMSDAPRAYLHLILRDFADQGIGVVLLGTPQSSQLSTLNTAQNSMYPAYVRFLEQLADRYGVPFVNLNDCPGITDADFLDGDHLSSVGSATFSRYLAEKVIHPALRAGAMGVR